MRENKSTSMPGGAMLAAALALLGAAGLLIKFAADAGKAHDVGTAAAIGVGAGLVAILAIVLMAGLYVVNPNEARVLVDKSFAAYEITGFCAQGKGRVTIASAGFQSFEINGFAAQGAQIQYESPDAASMARTVTSLHGR